MAQNLLSRDEFARTPAGQKPGASYQGYTSWVTNTRAKRAAARLAAAPDALAATPENVLGQQASQNVRAQIDPLIKEIMASTGRQAAQVGGLTETYASRLAPFEQAAKDRYATAAAGSAGVAQSLADRMSGAGASEGESLAAKLRAINAPGALVSEIAGGATDFGRGAGDAGYSTDASALQELISAGATARDYAGSLPGLARLEGQRAEGQVRGEGQRQIGDIRAKVPGLISNLMESGRDREVSKAIALRGLQEKAAGTVAEAKADRLKAEADAAADADKAAQSWTRIQQAGQRLKLQAGNASFNQGVSAAKLNLSQKQYGLALKRELRMSKGKAKGGFTPMQLTTMQATAYDSASEAFQGFYLDKDGVKVPLQKTPTELLGDLIGSGMPLSVALAAIRQVGSRLNAPFAWKLAASWAKAK